MVKELEQVPEYLTRNLHKHVIDRENSICSKFLRELGFAAYHDFDIMADFLRLWARSAPARVDRGQIDFVKNVIKIQLPDRGSPEREGADLVLDALKTLLDDIG